MAQAPSTPAWTAPSAKEMIETGTLRENIIKRHGGPESVFDDEELARLRDFVTDPEKAAEILKQNRMQDNEEDKPGAAAQRNGSLAGHIIAKHGTTGAVLTDDDIVALREWFANGNAGPSADA